MELTLVTVAASICMGLGAVFLFVAAVKRNWFRNIEDAKYQVFWATWKNWWIPRRRSVMSISPGRSHDPA